MAGDQRLYKRALDNAVQAAGGEEALRDYLQVNETTLRTWLTGLKPIPEQVFLKVIDLLLDQAALPARAPSQGTESSEKKS